jgi:hypothetical protein
MVEESISSVPVPPIPHEQNLCRTLLTPTCVAKFLSWTDAKEYAEGLMPLRGWIANSRIP